MLKVEYVPITSLTPYKNNAKLHPKEQVDQIIRSIRDYGMNDPIAVWRDNEIIEGHGRYQACLKMGIDEVPIIRLDELTDEQRREYMLVHNKTTMNSGFNDELLNMELSDLPDFDAPFYDFNIPVAEDGLDFFENRKRNDTSRQDGNAEYNEFLEKFEAKKTTDDCYTPDLVYDAVADWVAKEYNVDRCDFVRPFYPGGDYKKYKYENNAIVCDNPPFSILSEIVKFYTENGIKYFLFAPALTLFSSSSSSSAICVGVGVVYENGASVNTSFLTNLDTCRLRSAPSLFTALSEANDAQLKELHRELPKYIYPDYVITSTRCGQFSRYGIDFVVPREESERIRELDSQKQFGKAIFGSAYLLSEQMKEQKEKAEREKAEREKAERWEERWELSDREKEIVKGLSGNGRR